MLETRSLKIRALAAAGFLLMSSGPAAGAEGPVMQAKANNDVGNVASLQRGARNFVNYCMGCHSAKYVRYNRLAEDLGITEEELIENLMFAAEKPHETMEIAMLSADAERWFGQSPPDLSLIARARGTDYLFNFLRSFHADETRPTGVNNVMLPNVSMPHVLWELQGTQRAVFETEEHDGMPREVFKGFEAVSPGKLSPDEYDAFVRDIVNFLDYIGEPIQLQRQRIGILVIAFLVFFGILSYLLKEEIWKDVD